MVKKSPHCVYPSAASMSGRRTLEVPFAFEIEVSASRSSRAHGGVGFSIS